MSMTYIVVYLDSPAIRSEGCLSFVVGQTLERLVETRSLIVVDKIQLPEW